MIVCFEFFRRSPVCVDDFCSTIRWPPDVQGPFGDKSRRKNSTRTRQMTRSPGFFVQIGSQRVPERPEAKSCQILIRNCLLEAILEASRPASKPASQAQPLGRVFSTKRARGQERRVFSARLIPKWSLDVRMPTSGRNNSYKRTGAHRKNSRQKINLVGQCRILCFRFEQTRRKQPSLSLFEDLAS